MKTKNFFFIVLALVGLNACSEYQKVLKSTDAAYKYEKAVEYYEAEKYNQAYPLFDELLTLYRGTNKAAKVYYYFAYTNYQLRDYILAGYHFDNFYKTFGSDENAEEAAFMVGYCYYLESPSYSLDQTYTYKAINELQLFINTHRGSTYIARANRLIDSLQTKLETKSFAKAKLYYDLESYEAAVTALNNTLTNFPDTRFREEAHYYRLVAAYKFAENSIAEKKRQRYIEARTAYNDYIRKYPEGQFKLPAHEYEKKINLALELMRKEQNT